MTELEAKRLAEIRKRMARWPAALITGDEGALERDCLFLDRLLRAERGFAVAINRLLAEREAALAGETAANDAVSALLGQLNDAEAERDRLRQALVEARRIADDALTNPDLNNPADAANVYADALARIHEALGDKEPT